MKHLKTFEKLNKNIVDKNTINTDKIYVLKTDKNIEIIGKIEIDNNDIKNLPLMKGFFLHNDQPNTTFIKDNYWENIREAKPKEIEKYNLIRDKYNLSRKKHVSNYIKNNNKVVEKEKRTSKIIIENLFNLLKKLTDDILPNFYIVTSYSDTINITRRKKLQNNQNPLKTTCKLYINKNKINLKKQYGLINFDNEFILNIKCDNTDTYVLTIISYIINNITNNNTKYNKISIKEPDMELHTITFHENYFDQIINSINNLSIEDLKILLNEKYI